MVIIVIIVIIVKYINVRHAGELTRLVGTTTFCLHWLGHVYPTAIVFHSAQLLWVI